MLSQIVDSHKNGLEKYVINTNFPTTIIWSPIFGNAREIRSTRNKERKKDTKDISSELINYVTLGKRR